MYRGFDSGWAHGGPGYGFSWVGLVVGIILVALIAFAVYSIVRIKRTKGVSSTDSNDRGMDILIERYARGEIDADTFRGMKEVLEGKSSSAL